MSSAHRDTGVIVGTLMLACSVAADALPVQFWDQLRSKSSEERFTAVRAFALEQGGQTFEDTANVILIALADDRDDVRLHGAYILQRLARSTTGLRQPASPKETELASLVRTSADTAIDNGSDELAAQLSLAYTLYGDDSVNFELRMLARLNTSTSQSAQREFVDALAWGGLTAPAASARLLELASGGTTIVAHESALVLGALQVPSDQLMDVLVKLAATDDYFCDPNLLKPLFKNLPAARKHLSELKDLNARLVDELAMDAVDRKTKIYSPQFSLNTLRKLIASLEESH